MSSGVIAVGVDGLSSNQAVHWAIDWAGRRDAPLEFVHALPAPSRDPAEPGVDRRDQGLQVVQHEVALAHDANLTQVGICLADQPVAAALVAASERAALLVIGRRDTAAGIYRRSSSVSRHLSRYASCPVVVVPESMQPHDEKRIVLLLNGSAADQAALEFATDHAAVTGAEIEVIEALRTDWPEQDLLNLADHADMVVLPARLPTDDMLGPSEHELVTLRHAPCPVAYAR